MSEIRYVQDQDKTFWFSLDRHLSEHEFELKVRDKRGYVIENCNEPVGLMRYNLMWDTVPFLTLICIEEKFQDRGLGRLAMIFWENKMRSLGHKMVMTSTRVDEAVQHFYRKLGYVDRGGIFLDNTPLAQPQEMFMMKVF